MDEREKTRESLLPVEKYLKRDRASALDLCNRFLFTATVGIILIDFIGCCLRKQIVQAGVPLIPTLADIPLLFGLLVMTVGTFEFYKRFIEPFGEDARGSLLSLVGMFAMASLPFVLFYDILIPYRYLILSAYGFLVVVKNQQLKQRFRGIVLGRYYARWERQATVQALAAFDGGIIYYYFTEPHRYQEIVGFIDPQAVSIPSTWMTCINLLCGFAVLLVSVALFFVNEKDLLGKGDSQAELLAQRETDSPDATQDGLLLFSELSKLAVRLYLYSFLVRFVSSVNGALLLYLIIKLNGGAPAHSVVLASVATFFAIAAGFSLNDAMDIREDRINHRFRPVAAGSISRRSAVFVYCICLVSAIMATLLLSFAKSLAVVIAMLILTSAYSFYLKREWYLKNLTVAVAVTLIPLLALTITSNLKRPVFLVIGIFFWAFQKELLMDIRDIGGDLKAGIITFPIKMGREASAIVVAVANLPCWICVRPLLAGTVLGLTPVWTVVVVLHTCLVWLISRPLSTSWVRIYLQVQIYLTTIALVILLMRGRL